jgi:hypothetical protein
MIRRLIIFFLLGYCFAASAQLTVAEFIKSAERDPEVLTFKEQSRYLKTNPYQLPPVQRLEFRTQNRELMLEQQEFGLRLTPANPWEVRHNRNYFKTYESAIDLRSEIAFREALVNRYNAIIYYVYFKERAALIGYRGKLIEDQLSILQRQSGSDFFDADEFVDLQIDQMDRAIEFEEIQFSLLEKVYEIEKLYEHSVGDSLDWSVSNITDVNRITSIVDSLSSLSIASVLLAYQQRKIELAANEYKMEKANINAGFIQTEYDNRRQEQGRTPFNISLGVTIPIVNPNKGDMTKRQLDVIEAKYDLEEAKVEEKDKNITVREKLERLVKQYQTVGEKLRSYETGSLAGTLSVLERGDPRIIVKFNDNLVKLKTLLVRIRRDALLTYIEYLSTGDFIQQRPLLNYLSADLSVLE